MQRMTKQRQAVLDELTRVNDFRSAQQIFEDLRTNGQHVAQGHGFANVEHSLELFGTCAPCQEKNTTA